jgi:hypothetical protein
MGRIICYKGTYQHHELIYHESLATNVSKMNLKCYVDMPINATTIN